MYENFVGTRETVRNREVSAWRGSTVTATTMTATTTKILASKSRCLISEGPRCEGNEVSAFGGYQGNNMTVMMRTMMALMTRHHSLNTARPQLDISSIILYLTLSQYKVVIIL